MCCMVLIIHWFPDLCCQFVSSILCHLVRNWSAFGLDDDENEGKSKNKEREKTRWEVHNKFILHWFSSETKQKRVVFLTNGELKFHKVVAASLVRSNDIEFLSYKVQQYLSYCWDLSLDSKLCFFFVSSPIWYADSYIISFYIIYFEVNKQNEKKPDIYKPTHTLSFNSFEPISNSNYLVHYQNFNESVIIFWWSSGNLMTFLYRHIFVWSNSNNDEAKKKCDSTWQQPQA